MDFQQDQIFFPTLFIAGFFRDDLIAVKLVFVLAILDYIAT